MQKCHDLLQAENSPENLLLIINEFYNFFVCANSYVYDLANFWGRYVSNDGYKITKAFDNRFDGKGDIFIQTDKLLLDNKHLIDCMNEFTGNLIRVEMILQVLLAERAHDDISFVPYGFIYPDQNYFHQRCDMVKNLLIKYNTSYREFFENYNELRAINVSLDYYSRIAREINCAVAALNTRLNNIVLYAKTH